MLVLAGEERFHPLAVEAYLASCDLLRDGGGRWIRRRREVVPGRWDEAAGAAAGTDTRSRGAARARALAGCDARHCLRLVDPDLLRAERRARARQETGPTLPWSGVLVLAILVAAWWLVGPRSWDTGLGIGLLVLLGLLGLVALYGWLAERWGLQVAGDLMTGGGAAVALALAFGPFVSLPGWLKLLAQVVSLGLVFALIDGWSGRNLTARAAIGLERLSVLPWAVGVVWLLLRGGRGLGGWLAGRGGPAERIGEGIVSAIDAADTWILLGWGVILVLSTSAAVSVAFMSLFSSLRREAGDRAAQVEEGLRRRPETAAFPYYGRLWRDPDGDTVALQYFFFYAFNDWRQHRGVNFHEADWEWAMVVLERRGGDLAPSRVALSQHHSVEARPWEEVPLAGGSHPIVHVAVGSHANYFGPHERPLGELLGRSWLERIVAGILGIEEKSRRAAREGTRRAGHWLGRRLRTGREERLAVDDPNGRGLVIGPVMPPEIDGERRREEWSPVVLDGSQPWVDYPGPWGVRNRLRNESGPPGPRWTREEKLAAGERLSGREHPAWSDPRRRLENDARTALR